MTIFNDKQLKSFSTEKTVIKPVILKRTPFSREELLSQYTSSTRIRAKHNYELCTRLTQIRRDIADLLFNNDLTDTLNKELATLSGRIGSVVTSIRSIANSSTGPR